MTRQETLHCQLSVIPYEDINNKEIKNIMNALQQRFYRERLYVIPLIRTTESTFKWIVFGITFKLFADHHY